MPDDILVMTYNKKSKSAKALAKTSKTKFYQYPKQGSYVQNIIEDRDKPDIIINWGRSKSFDNDGIPVYNPWKSVRFCVSKTNVFDNLKQYVPVPEYTRSLDQAIEWVSKDIEVLGRKDSGTQGKDITFFKDDPEKFMGMSDFWVKYKPKKKEFRLHVGARKGQNPYVFSCQQKVLRKTGVSAEELAGVDMRIRSHSNGFVFQRNDIDVPGVVEDVAMTAFEKTRDLVGLDFGAMDIIYNEMEDTAYLLEINTAPGLVGTTLKDYLGFFSEA